MRVISPSYKRAGSVEVRKWLPDTILAVHEFEADEYRDREGGAIVALPDSARGNMAKVRNAILDLAEPDEWFVQLDDDVTEVGYFGAVTGEANHVVYTADQFYEFVEMGSMMADELVTAMWGVNVTFDPRFYREYSPLSLQSPVLGTMCVMKPVSGIRYDERLSLNEDYDIFLSYLARFRKVLRFDRNYYVADHLTSPGGCGSYRDLATEQDQAVIMQRKWGKDIVTFNFARTTNPRLHSPIPGM